MSWDVLTGCCTHSEGGGGGSWTQAGLTLKALCIFLAFLDPCSTPERLHTKLHGYRGDILLVSFGLGSLRRGPGTPLHELHKT